MWRSGGTGGGVVEEGGGGGGEEINKRTPRGKNGRSDGRTAAKRDRPPIDVVAKDVRTARRRRDALKTRRRCRVNIKRYIGIITKTGGGGRPSRALGQMARRIKGPY